MTRRKAGVRVGDWFLWIDAELARVDDSRTVPLVTLRKAVMNGDIIQTTVATNEIAKSLRIAADNIEKIMALAGQTIADADAGES